MSQAQPVDARALEALLRFYANAGVDIALCEEPVDRFALSRVQAETAARSRAAERQLRLEAERAAVEGAERPMAPASRAPVDLAVPSEAAV
ncbi:MAG: uracil-DNA glycosylase, partial [Pseudomonadota bacterium]|nr:uracil-DNA glycosylase [Pseudomonadota bacterium]